MNSVLQSLFHLPLFRRIVYEMPTQDVFQQTDSIPLNLHGLFYDMETRRATCSTRDLTRSFGWGDMEAFRQDDIQEFLQTLIQNLEKKLSKTDKKDAIANLMRGKTTHVISNERENCHEDNQDAFYELALPVKHRRTFESSLREFTTTERLTAARLTSTFARRLKSSHQCLRFISRDSRTTKLKSWSRSTTGWSSR
jgi:ubiquitin carboxyl-terminal hydrolase 7